MGYKTIRNSTHWSAVLLFLGPSLAVICCFFFLPVLAAFLLSFTDFDIYSLSNINYLRFVGFNNYISALQSPVFWTSLKNTFYFVVAGGPLSVAASLGAALLLNSKFIKFKPVFRLVYFLPVVTTLVAVSIVWRYVYHPKFGALNYLLSFVGVSPVDWLGDPNFSMPAIIILAVWKNFGYNMMIFVAGLQSIPVDYYEAASMEGASGWQQFIKITIPMLAPTTLFISIITMIGYFQLFAEPYVMTQGGPVNSTLSIVLYMYQEGFRWWNIGYSTALAFLLFVIILIGTLVQFRLQKDADN
ncbi:MAG: sugar ABC transporter permease [Ignavibacteriales bacterium]|nr:sugar ABC transporter permease [Ignavibacteriales bacterium]